MTDSELISTLKKRFEQNMKRHKNLEWAQVQARLEADAGKCRSLLEMESTGGEPDVFMLDESTGQFIFFDCSAESPAGRRSLCYDRAALDARKKFPPLDDALSMAATMGIEILTLDQYQKLQELGNFDTKTSSWVKTPDNIRKLGGALFCERRYGTVFVFHNGADAYYGARGFRGSLRI